MLKRTTMVAGMAAGLAAGSAAAQSLHLSYTVSEVGPEMYRYDFELTPCSGWEAGMAWQGLVWGDCASCPTPLTDFEGSSMSLPVGPWTGYTTVSGEHNGPMFADPAAWWEPASGDEVLRWSGVATSRLSRGELLFSALDARGGAAPVMYKRGVLEGACYVDCDGDGQLGIFDFLCFQNAFATGDSYADCDGCGALDFFDVLCYMDMFSRGCP